MEKIRLYTGDLRYNGMHNPLGVSTKQGTFSWKILGEGRRVRQLSCKIQIDTNRDFKEPVFEISADTSLPQWEMKENLEEKTRYFWRIYNGIVI